MGEFHAMHKLFVVFFALLACPEVLLCQGRQLKPTIQRSSSPAPQSTLPPLKYPYSVPSSANKKVDAPTMPNYEVAGLGDSNAPFSNAFQPTTPGNSPGAGHKESGAENQNMQAKVVVQSPDVKHSEAEQFEKESKSTTPGHSPGVGHEHQN